MEEPSARFEDIKIPLPEPVHGLNELSAVLGIPDWWPTGSRVAVVLAHGSSGDLSDPLVAGLHHGLTQRKYLTLRFNFPFAEAGKRAAADSDATLDRAFRAAIAMLGRDPTAAPAHLFLGGHGLGGRAAAQIATGRVRIEGVFFLGYPLHAQDKPEKLQPEQLYRIISPMQFVQGSRDRRCDIPTLRRVLSRVGAPTSLHVVEGADQGFKVPKKLGRSEGEVELEVLEAVSAWTEKILKQS